MSFSMIKRIEGIEKSKIMLNRQREFKVYIKKGFVVYIKTTDINVNVDTGKDVETRYDTSNQVERSLHRRKKKIYWINQR